MIDKSNILREAESRINARKGERKKRASQIAALLAGKNFNWEMIEDAARLATRAKGLGMTEEASELLHQPGDKTLGNKIFEKIIGANNLLDSHFLFEGARVSRAIGRIVLPVSGGNRLGTGFMVSPSVMMTNNHVMETETQAEKARVEFDFAKDEDGATGPAERYGFRPDLLFITDVGLDFTLVAVEAMNADGAQVTERGFVPLLGPSGKAVVGERVSIIQHPNGEPQKVALHDNKVTDLDGPFLLYETDTMGGSSGSPVFNINWDLAALHHAAVGKANEGIRISAIVAFLQSLSQDESVGAAPQLLSKVLSPEDQSAAGASVADGGSGSPGRSGPGNSNANGPQLNADGTATWTIPLSVTLGIDGQAADASGQIRQITDPADERPPAGDSGGPSWSGDDFEEAMRALEASEHKVYYSKKQDKADRAAYYADIDFDDESTLYSALSELLSQTHTTTLSYKKARLTHLYPWIDRREGSTRELRGIYSNKTFDALEVIRKEAAMQRRRESAMIKRLEAGGERDEEFEASLEAAHPFNCEHVVPQSWFNKRKQPKTDLHHLFTCEWGCNSFRGNRAYFDFSLEAFREDCGESANGKFEPKNGKGAVARATLYFLLRYPGDIADSSKEMPVDRLDTIIEWAKNDKIDRWELHRNAEIFKVQGNRNPLIDHPDIIGKIDFRRGWAD